MTDLNINAIFPTFVFSQDHPDAAHLNPELAREGYRLRELDPQGVQISNREGWQSSDDLNTRAEFAAFVAFVEEALNEVKNFLRVADDVTFRVSNCWFNINGRGSYNTRHVHANAFFSGVYYVSVSDKSGDIRFFDPNPVRECFNVPYKEPGAQNCLTHMYEPVEGRMLIFPGYVAHEVGQNQSDQERLSISFNVGAK